jgi:hypothetical protein
VPKYYDTAYKKVGEEAYVIHGYGDRELTMVRPAESLEEFELENIKELLEED